MTMNAKANKRRVMRRFYGRFHAVFIWQSTDVPAPTMNPTSIVDLLGRFDPKLHGGEAMAFAPVGREFGSPDYARDDGPLTAKDLATIRQEAAKHLPKGKLLSRKDLFA